MPSYWQSYDFFKPGFVLFFHSLFIFTQSWKISIDSANIHQLIRDEDVYNMPVIDGQLVLLQRAFKLQVQLSGYRLKLQVFNCQVIMVKCRNVNWNYVRKDVMHMTSCDQTRFAVSRLPMDNRSSTGLICVTETVAHAQVNWFSEQIIHFTQNENACYMQNIRTAMIEGQCSEQHAFKQIFPFCNPRENEVGLVWAKPIRAATPKSFSDTKIG